MATNKTNRKRNMTIGIIISLIILGGLLYLQEIDAKVLTLDVKWLVVASIPIILAILFSDIIQKFKGFGIELKTRLQEPIGKLNLIASDAISELPGDMKQSINYIQGMPATRRLRVQRLTFVKGHERHYSKDAVIDYINLLPNLKYFEIVNQQGKFLALIPIEVFRNENNTFIDDARISMFINSLPETENISGFFTDYVNIIIFDSLYSDKNLLEALRLVRKSKFNLLPVLTNDNYLLGIVTSGLIESKIADEVLNS